jgi:hypothetical protein
MAQKVRMQEQLMKTMLAEFFDDDEFMPDKQTANGRFYKGMIKRLIARVRGVRREFKENWPWYLLHHNAPAHSLGVSSEFLVK